MGHKIVIYQEPFSEDTTRFIGLEIDGKDMELVGHKGIEFKGGPGAAEVRFSVFASDVQIKTLATLQSEAESA